MCKRLLSRQVPTGVQREDAEGEEGAPPQHRHLPHRRRPRDRPEARQARLQGRRGQYVRVHEVWRRLSVSRLETLREEMGLRSLSNVMVGKLTRLTRSAKDSGLFHLMMPEAGVMLMQA